MRYEWLGNHGVAGKLDCYQCQGIFVADELYEQAPGQKFDSDKARRCTACMPRCDGCGAILLDTGSDFCAGCDAIAEAEELLRSTAA